MAAERTFLAWIRTGTALMGFGFIVARFDLFLREMAMVGAAPHHRAGFSLAIGVAMIVAGIVVNFTAALRHHRYVRAIDRGEFQRVFGSNFAFAIAALLAVIGFAIAIYLSGI
jgi:putative membrane protein